MLLMLLIEGWVNNMIRRRKKTVNVTKRRIKSSFTKQNYLHEKLAKERFSTRLVNSMSFDEMLEASQIVEMLLRGEKLPSVMSPKVQKYVNLMTRLHKNPSTRSRAKKMQQELNSQIIERNRLTINMIEANQFYNNLVSASDENNGLSLSSLCKMIEIDDKESKERSNRKYESLGGKRRFRCQTPGTKL